MALVVQRSYANCSVHCMKSRSFRHSCRHLPFGTHIFAGAVGVLTGLQHLFTPRTKCLLVPERTEPGPMFSQSEPEKQEKRLDYFSIRRTKSELGYVYWMLCGYGEFRCFVLYDTWGEAVDEAFRRLSEHRARSLPLLAAAMSAA